MGPRLLVISLVPPLVLAQTLRSLRACLPEAHVTALLGTFVTAGSRVFPQADELLDWRTFGSRALVAKLRSRRFHLVVVLHGADHYLTRSYWKAIALALSSGARAKLLCPVLSLIASGDRVEGEEGRLSSQAYSPGRVARLAHHPSTWAGLLAPASLLTGSVARAAFLAAQETYVAGMGLLLLALVLLGIIVTDLTEALTRFTRPGEGPSAGGARARGKGGD